MPWTSPQSSLDPRHFVCPWLVAHVGALGRPRHARAEAMTGAFVFADISGFSALARRYADRGLAGVEAFSLLVGNYLARLMDLAIASGGQIEDLYGDALLVFWAAEPNDPTALSVATRRAVDCARAMIRGHDRYEIDQGIVFRLRAAVMAGDAVAYEVGGVADRWHFAFGGTCLEPTSALLAEARPGEIAYAASVRGLLTYPNNNRATAPKAPEQATALDADLMAALWEYLPPSLRDHAALPGVEWTADFRPLAVTAITIPSLRCRRAGDLPALQRAVHLAQEILYQRFDAEVRLSLHDKGTFLLARFGLPGKSHDDDPVRALLAGEEVVAALDDAGFEARCVVSAGIGYCGILGSSQRLASVAWSDAVNRAAKLVYAPQPEPVACDAPIATAAATLRDFVPVVGEPHLFVPRRPQEVTRLLEATPLAGRRSEFARLCGLLQRQPRAILLQGAAGAGKSTLVHVLTRNAPASTRVLIGAADAVTRSPYAAWRSIFDLLLPAENRGSLGNVVPAALNAAGLDLRLVPLLNSVLSPLGNLPSPARQHADMLGPDAAIETRHALLAVLRYALGNDSTLLVLEDVHWMDEASWMLAAEALRTLPSLSLCLASRPPDSAMLRALDALRQTTPLEVVELGPLDPDALGQMLAQRFDCDAFPPSLVAALHARSEGNPFFALQLALTLRDQGVLRTNGRVCQIDGSLAQAVVADLPSTVQRAVLARIDRQPLEHQLQLKAAAQLGASFSAHAVAAVVPGSESAATVAARLDALRLEGILALDESGFRFEHALVREVVRELTPFAQRRQLAAAAARYLEAEFETASADLLGALWWSAGEPDRALPYLEQAGEAALASGAYREAAEAFEHALEALRAVHPSDGGDPLRVARLRRLAGEGHMLHGTVDEAIAHLRTGLETIGHRWPSTQNGQRLRMVRELAALAWSLMLRRRGPRETGVLQAGMLFEAMRGYEALGNAFGLLHDGSAGPLAMLCSIGIARRHGDAGSYARAAAALAAWANTVAPRIGERFYQEYRDSARLAANAQDRIAADVYASLYLLGGFRLRETEELLSDALVRAEAIGFRRRRDDMLSIMGGVHFGYGDFDACEAYWRRFAEGAEIWGDPQLKAIARTNPAAIAAVRGDAGAMLAAVEGAASLATRLTPTHQVQLSGYEAYAAWLLGDAPRAITAAHTVLAIARLGNPRARIAFYSADGMFRVCEVYLAALEAPPDGPLGPLRATAKVMVRSMDQFACIHPFCRPRRALLLGRYSALRGNRRRAYGLLQQAYSLAQKINAPYDLALAQAELAMFDPTAPAATKLANEAAAILQRLGAAPALRRLEERLREAQCAPATTEPQAAAE